jgi:hypothetical protein
MKISSQTLATKKLGIAIMPVHHLTVEVVGMPVEVLDVIAPHIIMTLITMAHHMTSSSQFYRRP